MGRITTRTNHMATMSRQHDSYFSAIHRARVVDVHVDLGTCSVQMESSQNVLEVQIPLLGLSIVPGDTRGLSSAWGRYIPQEGDMLLIGFDTNGDPYALGYQAVSYKYMKQLDDDNEERGGIGWGDASGTRLKPGDWDFMSRGNSRLYLTDRAGLYSGAHSLVLDKTTDKTTLSTALLIKRFGTASESRDGVARRLKIITDTEETDIPSATGGTAQESTNIARQSTILLPTGYELARTSIGEVIDELTFLPMVPAMAYPDLTNLAGTGVSQYRSVTGIQGQTEFFAELVDDLGNYGVSATTATAFQWATPLADWEILSKSFKVTATEAVEFLCTEFAVTSSSSTHTTLDFSVDSPSVSLGTGAAEGLVKGNTFNASLMPLITALAAGSSATNPATVLVWAGTVGAAATTFLALMQAYVSGISKTA